MATQGRNNAIDLIKIFMAIFVISIHTIVPDDTIKYLLTQSVARVAVPFFFIAAGYYFPSKPKNSDIKKTTLRLVYLYIAWCVFYLPFEFSDIATKPLSFSGYIWESLYILVKGWRHLWFMPALIIGLVIYYFLHANKRIYLIALSLYILGFTLQLSIKNGEYSILFYRNFLTFAFPLIVMGAALKRYGHSVKAKVPGAVTLLFLTVMLCVEGYTRLRIGVYNNDLLVFSPLVAACIFLLTLDANVKTRLNISSIASSIYFIHYSFYLILKSHIESHFFLFFMVSVFSLLFSLTLNKSSIYRRFLT